MAQSSGRLDAELYQLSGEDLALDHIAGSGHLSLAALYANHGSESVVQGVERTRMPTPTMDAQPPQNLAPISNASSATETASLRIEPVSEVEDTTLDIANLSENAPNALPTNPATKLPAAPEQPMATLATANPPGGGGDEAEPALVNGNNGQNGNDGSDGNDGANSMDGQSGNGSQTTNITIINTTNNSTTNHHHETTLIDVGDTNLTQVTHHLTQVTHHLLNVNLGGDTFIGNHPSNGGTLIDIDIFQPPGTPANGTSLIDLDLLGTGGNTGGNDHDLVDLDLLGTGGNTGGSDNDLVDLDLLGTGGNTGGNDHDLVDLDLLGTGGNTGGNDHDLVDLDVDLLNDGGLGSIELGLAEHPLLDLSVQGQDTSSHAPMTLDIDLTSPSGNGEHCTPDLLLGGLEADLSLEIDQLAGNLDLTGHVPDMPATTGSGTLGLQLGLGAWL